MNRFSRACLVLLASLAVACARREEAAEARDTVPPPPPPPHDSLALTARGGVEVWFTASRAAKDSAGQGCVERVMEIRRDGRSIPIPLLYTGSAPRLVNDSTIEAPIWLNCRPGNVYQVNLRTGHPVRVR
jgi:hypothetical protein